MDIPSAVNRLYYLQNASFTGYDTRADLQIFVSTFLYDNNVVEIPTTLIMNNIDYSNKIVAKLCRICDYEYYSTMVSYFKLRFTSANGYYRIKVKGEIYYIGRGLLINSRGECIYLFTRIKNGSKQQRNFYINKDALDNSFGAKFAKTLMNKLMLMSDYNIIVTDHNTLDRFIKTINTQESSISNNDAPIKRFLIENTDKIVNAM